MAFYTPPSLPRTPYAMNALPTELTWALPLPITPPMSTTLQQRKPTAKQQLSLPPIAHLERQLATRAPYTNQHPAVTPPEDVFPPNSRPIPEQEFSLPKPDAPYMDWLDISRTRPAHFIAEKTCEMICYLWFATSAPEHSYPTPTNSPPFSRRPSSSTTSLQLVATPTFVQFMQKLLETTQVSQSVIVLSLHYIYRLKDRNRFTPAQPGSEFRIAVAGLMMANKFLDDNTYTNKTWSEVSGIDLAEINRMEREFLMGVEFNLYVDKPTYESWMNLLKGLVLAKERDSRHFRKSRTAVRAAKHAIPHGSSGPASRTYTSLSSSARYRARSTSPSETRRVATYSYSAYPPTSTTTTTNGDREPEHEPEPEFEPASPPPAPPPTHVPRSGSKRTAATAFSPTASTYAHAHPHPSKRPVPITLQIPEYSAAGTRSAPHSHSPLEGLGLQSFATMTLGSPRSQQQAQQGQGQGTQTQWTTQRPETLVAPYCVNEERRAAVPQNLYFYTLACSPMDGEDDIARSDSRAARKARLRYHQPQAPAAPAPSTTATATTTGTALAQYYLAHAHAPAIAPPRIPTIVQSASTSPLHQHHHHALEAGVSTNANVMPHFQDARWRRAPGYQASAPVTVAAVAAAAVLPPLPPMPPLTPLAPLPPIQTLQPLQPLPPLPHHQQQQRGHATLPPLPPMPALPLPPLPPMPALTPLPPQLQTHVQPQQAQQAQVQAQVKHASPHGVPSAPFANAGPPGIGVQFYPTPVQGAYGLSGWGGSARGGSGARMY
ncbi:hypothetical protein H0H92_006877 [Tricholoma furcatifolium]|nr:hypothetical protein H0H92_006877 [Tricholoma furcatifolium]